MSNTQSKAEIEALVKRHGATSYRNRADTQHPAYGFTKDGLNGLIDEVLAKWGQPSGAGEVVATKNEVGQIVAVTRQDEEGRILSVIAESSPQPTQAVPPTDLAQLRHMYQNMLNGGVRDTASAKRIAEGLLAPVIERMERAVSPAGREPLTDAQAQELIELESWGPDAIGLNAQLLRTIRRTEAAHGIQGKEAGMPDLSNLTERGAKAWAGVDAQKLREDGTT